MLDIQLHTQPQHQELIRLFTIDAPHCAIILGLQWLKTHDPTMVWSIIELMFNSASCLQHHLTERSSSPKDLSLCHLTTEVGSDDTTPEPGVLPPQYWDLEVAFNI